jgi:energy-coupling factor transporter ATP-binding protein EcfA2
MARQTSYVFQHPDQQLFARSVAAEVAFAPRLRALPENETRNLVEAALERTGLGGVAEEHPYDLPPAQRKLVALAAALAQQPQVLVLDEPTQGLDGTGMNRVIEVVRRLASDGVAVLAATHDLPFVVEALDRSVVLVEGELKHDGGSRELVWDEPQSRLLGLDIPHAVRLSRRLHLPGRPVRAAEVARALAPFVR